MANFEEHKKVTRAGAETVKREAWKTKLEKKWWEKLCKAN